MSYSPDLAAALSGASMGQLQYWRSTRTSEPLLAPEHYRPHARVMYSFRDVIALRTFVFLRSRDIPLQKVRKAVHSLRKLGATDHLASYRLVPIGKNVAWRESDHEVHDLTSLQQSHPALAEMVDVLSALRWSEQAVGCRPAQSEAGHRGGPRRAGRVPGDRRNPRAVRRGSHADPRRGGPAQHL
jgi:hypothetical protein